MLHPIRAWCGHVAAARGFLQAYERYKHRKSGSGHAFCVGAAMESDLCFSVVAAAAAPCLMRRRQGWIGGLNSDCDREVQRQLLRLPTLTFGQTSRLCLLALLHAFQVLQYQPTDQQLKFQQDVPPAHSGAQTRTSAVQASAGMQKLALYRQRPLPNQQAH